MGSTVYVQQLDSHCLCFYDISTVGLTVVWTPGWCRWWDCDFLWCVFSFNRGIWPTGTLATLVWIHCLRRPVHLNEASAPEHTASCLRPLCCHSEPWRKPVVAQRQITESEASGPAASHCLLLVLNKLSVWELERRQSPLTQSASKWLTDDGPHARQRQPDAALLTPPVNEASVKSIGGLCSGTMSFQKSVPGLIRILKKRSYYTDLKWLRVCYKFKGTLTRVFLPCTLHWRPPLIMTCFSRSGLKPPF